MKASIQTLIHSSILDNRRFILENGGNIKEYFELNFEAGPENFFDWLTQEEIDAWEKGEGSTFETDFRALVSQYDLDIDRYIELK